MADDRERAPSSYGFGKAAFYIISGANAVIIDTLTTNENERRLIAYALGEDFEDEEPAAEGDEGLEDEEPEDEEPKGTEADEEPRQKSRRRKPSRGRA